MKSLLFLTLTLTALASLPSSTLAALSCSSTTFFGDADAFCESKIGVGSICLPETETCSSIYTNGCLRTKLGDDHAMRACNSDDGENTTNLCLPSVFNYTEIRIHHSNWESSIFYSWILQILLSERLQVPVTIGVDGATNAKNSFYSEHNTLEYSSVTYPWDAIEEANRVLDCSLTDKPCTHVLPEVWNGAFGSMAEAVKKGHADPPEGDGQVGKISYYIPATTADAFPEFVSFRGLTSKNRQKIAATFLRPATWKQYCDEEAPDKCATTFAGNLTAANPALRYPQDDDEGALYYSAGNFLGHFRMTDESNCASNPDTCTGHVVAPPCTWSTFLDSQLYYNDMPFTSSGPNDPNGSYTYGQMIQLYRAASATQNHIFIWWWTPEPLVEIFRGSEYEFQQVLLPDATSTCKRARVTPEDRCSIDDADRTGSLDGSCDGEAHALQKVLAASLGQEFLSQPIAERSPGHATIRNFKIDNLDMNEILRQWIQMGIDQYGHDAREVVCEWVANNIDDLEQFIPLGYPRELSLESTYDTPFLIGAQILATIAAVLVLAVGAMVFRKRKTRVMVYAQVYFVLMLIGGYFLIVVGAIVYVADPDATVCASREWLVTLGYTLELTPLLVKISAMNRVVQSAKRMKRVKISAKTMILKILVVMLAVLSFLILWTIVDPPSEEETRVLESESSNLIISTFDCASKSHAWLYATQGWQVLLLLMATVLAFQTRNVHQEFNETRSLGTMVYSHFLFEILRVVVTILGENGSFDPNVAAGAMSYLLTFDVLFAMSIYIAPKLWSAQSAPNQYRRGATGSMISMAGQGNGSGSGGSSDAAKSSGASSHGSRRFQRGNSMGNPKVDLVRHDRASLGIDGDSSSEEDDFDARLGLGYGKKPKKKSGVDPVATTMRNSVDVSIPIDECSVEDASVQSGAEQGPSCLSTSSNHSSNNGRSKPISFRKSGMLPSALRNGGNATKSLSNRTMNLLQEEMNILELGRQPGGASPPQSDQASTSSSSNNSGQPPKSALKKSTGVSSHSAKSRKSLREIEEEYMNI